MAENHEEVVGGNTVMDVQGSGGHIRGVVDTKPLKFTTTTATTALLEPVMASTFAVIDLDVGCVLGSSITVIGSARGDRQRRDSALQYRRKRTQSRKTDRLSKGKGRSRLASQGARR